VLSLSLFVGLAACNTVSGIGADITDASEATRDAFRSEPEQPKTSSTNDGTKPEAR
jgi:predicted small secreted protein